MTGSALARADAARLPAGAGPANLDFGEMLRRAEVLARSGLVPPALKDNPQGIVLVGAYGAELGIPLTTALAQIDVIENRADPCAQLRIGLIRAAGHEVRWIETTDQRAVVKGRRREYRDDPEAWVTVTWTIEDARRAQLSARWVERWKSVQRDGRTRNVKETVILGDDRGIYTAEERARLGLSKEIPEWAQALLDAGDVKSKDNWTKYPADMLRARAAKALSRMEFSDVLAALNVPEWDGDSDLDLDEPLPERDESGVAAAGGEPAPGGEEVSPDAGEIVCCSEGVEGCQVEGDHQHDPYVEAKGKDATVIDMPSRQEVSWKQKCKEAGISQGDLIRQAWALAERFGIEKPATLDDIVEPELVAELSDWLSGARS